MRPPNVTKAVWDELDHDIHAQAALRRGVLNARALARTLKRRLDLDASIPGIVSAIKRYPLEGPRQRAEQAKQALSDIRVATRTQVACAGLRKDPAVHAILPRLFEQADPSKGDAIRIVQGEEGIFVFLEEDRVDALLERLAPEHVIFVHRHLAELSVREPPWTQTVPGPLFLLTGALYAQGINIWHLLGVGTEVHVLIDEKDLSAAHQTLLGIRQGLAPEGAPVGRPGR